MLKTIELEKLQATPVDETYFPYCQIDGFIRADKKAPLKQDFPEIQVRGSIPASKLKYGPTFQDLIDDLYSDELKNCIAEKFKVNLSQTVPLLTVRGYTDQKDGHIHIDTKSKVMTILLYLNDDWNESTGNLRLLRDNVSLENHFAEIKPTFGKLLVFKVTPNCWHGHYPFEGKRKTLQLNYVTSPDIVKKELRKHAQSFNFKQFIYQLKNLFYEKNSTC